MNLTPPRHFGLEQSSRRHHVDILPQFTRGAQTALPIQSVSDQRIDRPPLVKQTLSCPSL
jgi:hypothetical protein